jgi:glycosyltransferase involved in cell wall biosynthesis
LVVGSVTRLSPQKAPLDLVEAFGHVSARFPGARFVIVGDGPLREQVEARLDVAGLSGIAILTGLRRDIPELMSAFDVFVLSSLWEGLPRVLPQAMATGLPVVCTAADGSAEAISDGENGIIVQQRDALGMAAGICRLLADPVLRRQMGENGRRKSRIFGADQMVANIDRLYQRLIS